MIEFHSLGDDFDTYGGHGYYIRIWKWSFQLFFNAWKSLDE